MGRRTVLLVVAALIAALGTSLVFLYVRGVDARADQKYDAVQVLQAVKVIEPGETLDQAKSAGKIAEGSVAQGQVLSGVLTNTVDMGSKVALTKIFPGEQIVSAKFGDPGDQEVLTIPEKKMAISVNLTDPSRVAGFVTPGAEVAVFVSAEPELILPDGEKRPLPEYTRILLPRVQVVGVGDTTVVSQTTVSGDGEEQTTEEVPKTLLTLAVDQAEAERVIYAAKNGEVAFALLTEDSVVKAADPVTAENVFE
ncbi:MAG: hypothetical protein AVDCRST_MAG72-324 [uncultured Nocardioidaceae bacterium]|uniref:Flp pilus assembly protein RcpC/CpaB domain-containing protein n=1 Tax=uncultured Nocardioidaceae bacterium TaxID=253824 RepID=A0A6J4LDV2_9ACTN|nr:MAG: hypothetical protein AVDCRST_MAG72-324 [uncultured Nocardioidaceae bacterium]